MSTTTITAPTAAAETTTSPTCESCSHSVTKHDLIAIRYCRATADGALIRACICKSGPS